MRYILTILLFFNSAMAQDYVAHWVTIPKEQGIVNYQVQKSSNNITWTTIATIQPKKGSDSNKYEYTIPTANNYIRIKALTSKNIIYTSAIKVVNTNVAISSPLLKINSNSDNVSFTAVNEAAIDYYNIERNNNNSSRWVIVGKLMQTGKKNYAVNISKNGSNRKYRLIAVYKNGLKTEYLNFKDED